MSADTDSEAETLFERFWQWRLESGPEFASYCGIHDYDDHWDDISQEAYSQREVAVREFLLDAEAMDQSSCSKKCQDDLALFIKDLKMYLKGTKFKSYLLPMSFLEGVHNDVHVWVGYHSFTTVEGFHKYIARLKALPNRILQNIPLMKQGIAERITFHLHSMSQVIGQLDGMLTENVDESVLIKPFLESGGHLPPDVLASLKKEAIDEIMCNIRPALTTLKDFIEKEYMHHLRSDEGVGTLKEGAAYYQQCLNYHNSCDMNAEEIHVLGLQEVARIRKKMLEIAQKEGFGDDLKAFQQKLHTSDEFTFKSADEVMSFVKDICENQIRPRLTQLFHTLPDIPLILKPTPAAQATAPAGYYLSGTVDKSRPGVYYVNGNNLDSCKKYEFMALSLHEGEPGHHLQISSALSAKMPSFRQYQEDEKYYLAPGKFAMHSAFVEGWGLYSEALGMELGLYTDNYTLFGRYSMEMLRAARLVVDTGIHAMRWRQDRAVKYLVENTLTDEWSMTNEVNRYITWPGQACAYKIGELKIWELRHKAERELGSEFDVRDFHATVLGCGSVPLTFLEHAVDDYINSKKSQSKVV